MCPQDGYSYGPISENREERHEQQKSNMLEKTIERNVAVRSIVRMKTNNEDTKEIYVTVVDQSKAAISKPEHCQKVDLLLKKLVKELKSSSRSFRLLELFVLPRDCSYYSLPTSTSVRHFCVENIFNKIIILELKFIKIIRFISQFCVISNNFKPILYSLDMSRRLLFSNRDASCVSRKIERQSELIKRARVEKSDIYLQDSHEHYVSASFDVCGFKYFLVNVQCPELSYRCVSLTNLKLPLFILDLRFVNFKFENNVKTMSSITDIVCNNNDTFGRNRMAAGYLETTAQKDMINVTLPVQESENNTNVSLKKQEHKLRNRCTIILNEEHVRMALVRENTRSLSNKKKNMNFSGALEEKDDVNDTKAILRNNTQPSCDENRVLPKYTVAPVFRKEESKNRQDDTSTNVEGEQESASLQESAVSNDATINENLGAPLVRNDAAAPSLDAQDEVRVDGGHGSTCFEHHIQTSTTSPKNTDSNKTVSSPNSFGNGENVQENVTANALPDPNVDDAELQRFEPLMQIIDKIADGERVPPQITMRYEMLRFCTLRSFPKVNKPYITRLAQAGFYYANSGDEVVCYSCARRKSNWQEGDQPMDIHRQLNPNCSFLVRNSEVNVPVRESLLASERSHVQTDRSNTQTNTSQSRPIGSSNGTSPASTTSSQNAAHQPDNIGETSYDSILPSQQASQKSATTSSAQQMACSTESFFRRQPRAHGNFVQADAASTMRREVQQQSLTVTSNAVEFSNRIPADPVQTQTATGTNVMPKYPKYASNTVRVTSFTDCSEIVVRPESLAEAGFFYAGFGDCVRCFQCGVGLRHWSEEDDPWIEHSRWSKDCSFVKQMRGQEFVNLVQMAVQYSQHQNRNQENRNETVPPTSNQGASGGDETENLMHTDAAQSVLEMGYDPNIIRRAIRASILENNGRQNITATNLMEKIFEIEEAEPSAASLQTTESPVHQQTSSTQNEVVGTSTSSVAGKENISGTQTTRGESQSNKAEDIKGTSTEGASASAHKSGSESASGTASLNYSKKSQLLEQKKLKEENEKLKQQSICTKCKKKDVCIVFLPCGHLVTCEECAPTVKYCTMQSCGKYIKGTVRTYLA